MFVEVWIEAQHIITNNESTKFQHETYNSRCIGGQINKHLSDYDDVAL
jgi:hypothetical protein